MKIAVPAWLSEKSKKFRAALIACAALFCVSLMFFLTVLAPVAAQLRSREERYASLRKNHADAVLFQKQKKAFAGIRAGIPTQTDMPLLVKELLQTARRQKLSVGSVKFDIPKHSAERLTMLSFSLPVEGRYPNIKRFIHKVETSDRVVGIQELKMASERGRVKLQMKLVTYIKGS